MTRKNLLALATASALAVACGGGGAPGGDDDDDDVPDAAPRTPDASFGPCEGGGDPGALALEGIATWRDDAKAAYSMIHDDMCGPGLEGIQDLAVPALAERGLAAGLGPFVQVCEEGNLWGVVQQAEALGNEIISHSYTHPEITPANAAKEVAEAKAAIEQHTVNPVTFFIFPYDFWTPATLQAVGNAGYFGARAGSRDDNDGFENPPINPAEGGKDLEIEFDVWPRSYSKYALYKEADLLNVHVWNAMDKGGWAVREFHSVMADNETAPEDRGFGPIKISAYKAHLDFLADLWTAGKVWTAPPSAVLKYRRARTACKASLAGTTITFDTSSADCTKYATPLSVIVTTASDVPRLDAVQGGAPVATRKLADKRFSVTADPTKGPVELSACENDGPKVDPSIALLPRPMPAASVCELETVKGAGSAGQMDDLERPLEQFQVLPNPSQADGRTGSWSWYPQPAQVAMVKDGGNTVLRYAGTNLAAWSGVTLAFLGGNGAGACYDASKYKGIRFKIKGNVSSSDELAGKVIMSLVTSETQSRRYGGDLDGEGGHFNTIVPVTSSWQTVSIMWSDLKKPTWGATTSLPAVAVGKLQAIDWGVSDKTTSFEVFLDDIELF